jgi:membrane protease YdiL (CAAX protease family)
MYWRYPLWALVQQWILLRAIAPRMRALFGSEIASGIAVGALFGLLHVPNFGLMVATFAAGSAWAVLGYRHRALLPLAVSHVALGLTLFAISPPWLLRSAEIGVRFLMLP